MEQPDPRGYSVERVTPLPVKTSRPIPGGQTQSGRPLRVIRIRAGEQPRAVDEAETALIDAGLPLFVRGGHLVRPILEEAPATGHGTTLVARLKPPCLDSLADLIGRAATFQRYSEPRKEWLAVDPPRWAVSMLLARAGEWRFPSVAGIISTPTLRPDGSLLDVPGYDPTTRLYMSLDPTFRMPTIETSPSRQDAERALALLADLLCEFPFVGPVDRAVALSGLLTTVLRPGLPVAPLHAIRTHTAGTGKSFLINLFAAIALGRRCPAMAAGKTEEETEKRLGAQLLQADPIISIDNVNGELGGDMLCQMTEQATVRVRIFGKSEAPELECRSMVFANGNNLVLVGDMTRRTVLCTLDAGVERPELREFKHKPNERVLADRGVYVAAVLTIARAYRAAGSPPQCPPIGSYEAWSDMVRSALVWLGEADPVASMETARAEDPELTTIKELFGHWREDLAEASFYTAAQVIDVGCERDSAGNLIRPEFCGVLIRKVGKGLEPSPIAFGRWLPKIKGRVVDGYRLEAAFDERRGNRFALCRVREVTP